MELLKTAFFTLLALGVLITVHEFGHFWVARRLGVKVLRFSIGFGAPLWRWCDRQGTEFVVAALPLGGYVKMADEREGPVAPADLDRAFNRKPVAVRMAVVAAGPAANFLLAFIAYWAVFLGGVQGVAPVVGEVVPGSPAERAGLAPGQEIVAVDGELTPTWKALGEALLLRAGEEGEILLEVRYPESSLTYTLEAPLAGYRVDPERPDPIRDFGIVLYTPPVLPVVGDVLPGGPAERAGLKPGDRILAVDGEPVADWQAFVDYVRARPGEPLKVVWERQGVRHEAVLTPRPVPGPDGTTVGQVGIAVAPPSWPPHLVRELHYSPLEGLGEAGAQTARTTRLVLDSLVKMATGALSAAHLSGPITIAKVAGTSAEYGAAAFLGFLALLSVSLAVLNLLPIPVLDGGHLLFYAVEAARGRPVSERVQSAAYRVGLALVVGLMVLALYNDLSRL
ncbi:MAG: zinc metalloprotease [Porticoccaceae bacterium]|nr:MAG: zinc metalloprotease [Porticoccaceae bacterium]